MPLWRSIVGSVLDIEREGIDDGRSLGVGVATESPQLRKCIEVLLPADRLLHADDVVERRSRNQPAAGNLDNQRSWLNVGEDKDRFGGTGRGHEHIDISRVGLPLRIADEVIRVYRMVRHRTEIGQRVCKAEPIVTVGANEHVDVPRDVFDCAVKQSRRAANHDVPDVVHSESIDDPIKIEWSKLWRRHAAELRRNER